MKRIVFKIVLSLVVTTAVSVSAFAWPDGQREGLLLGLTGGIANASFESDSGSESGLGFMAGTIIGGGINEQFLLDFRFRYWNSDIDSVTYHTWSWCGDAIWFPVKDNGFFLNGGIGRALVLPDLENADSKGGMFFYAGIGYEITKWVFLSVDYAIGSFEDDIESGTLTFAVSAIGY